MELISKQAAFDALNHELRCGAVINQCGLEAAYEVIEDLPSTQPEIIYCKDYKHHWTYKCMDSMPIERCDLEQTFYDAEIDYCSLAERREDG